MSAEIPTLDIRTLRGFKRWRLEAENQIVVVALGAMMTLPLLEIVLRRFSGRGIPNVSAIVQHLTLLVGVFGGALAARDQRLLSLSPLSGVLKGRWKEMSSILSHGWSGAICVWLMIASLQFITGEKRLAQELAFGIPKWWVQYALPFGFTTIALRMIWTSGPKFWQRGLTLCVIGALLAIGQWGGLDAEKVWPFGLLLLGLATALGAPVFITLGGAALILFWGHGENVAIVANRHYSLSTNSTLPSIPLFTLAGYFLAEGGASKRIIRVFQAFFGSLRGGPAIVTALVCAFFTSFTGASGVTILALGGLLMPVLQASRYSERAALGLLTSAGSLGLLFPPCLPLILYVIVANTSAQAGLTLREMFWAGIGPGTLLVILTAAWGIRAGGSDPSTRTPFDWREAGASLVGATWELLVPVVALVSMFSGWATPVEASAVTAVYALITQTLCHRDLHPLRDLPRVMTECGLLIGGVLLILGVALGLTHWMVDAHIPTVLAEWVTAKVTSPYLFLLAVNGFLLIVGCLMDIFSAIVVVVPLLVPLASKFGIDPLHFGIIFLANMELGFLTPPVGMNLFLASYRFKKPMSEVTRAVLPMLVVLAVGVLLITYVPQLTLWLPRWFGK